MRLLDLCLLENSKPLAGWISCSLAAIFLLCFTSTQGQSAPSEKQSKAVHQLIDKYSEAREKKDTVLLKAILTEDVDQLVSNGEWRNGIQSSVKGMLKSSAASPGTRTLVVDKIRMLNKSAAIVDCRYEIVNPDGSLRKMWSTFVVLEEKSTWRISAIRNMLPGQP